MNAMTTETPTLTREKDCWLVRVKLGGRIQEMRCPTEGQARYFAAMLALNPLKPTRFRN
jgi:hypothetical protein